MRKLLLTLSLLVTACGGANDKPANVARPGYGPATGQAALPGTLPGALPGLFGTALRFLPADMACPPPWVPPEAARLMDCAALKKASGAVAFVPRAVVAASLPPVVDLRAARLTGPIKNQQQVGACAGFALSSVLDNAARRAGSNEVISPLHVFATYAESEDMGTVKGRYMTNEAVWPYDPTRACRFAKPYHAQSCESYYGVRSNSWRESAVLVNERAHADESGRVPIMALEEIPAPLDPVQLAALLADGEAVWSALAFDRSAWSALDDQGGSYLPQQANPNEAHAVTIVGYRQGRYGREFILQNSWGTSWGENGYAYVPESVLTQIWNFGYRVRTTGSPSGGVSAGGATSCAAGQTSLFGFCVPSAPSGGLPSGWPAGFPTSLPSSLPSCPSGSLPNPLSGGCITLSR